MQTAAGRSFAASAQGSAPSLTEASFAQLLSSMATANQFESVWNDDDLADDVATISYNHAVLAAHPGHSANSAPAHPLKTSSITIRVSQTECAQLRKRAAEAGLTLSAYLRSCTLEVESLRAQVKQTLAELRNSTPAPGARNTSQRANHALAKILARLGRWLAHFWPHRRAAIPLNPANPFAPVRS